MKRLIVRFNIDKLLRQLSVLNNRDYEKQFVATRTGISRSAFYNIIDNINSRVDLDTLGKLLLFFHEEGMIISMSDLFTVTVDDPTPHEKSTI